MCSYCLKLLVCIHNWSECAYLNYQQLWIETTWLLSTNTKLPRHCIDNSRQQCLLVYRGKTAKMCKEEFLVLAQQEDGYGTVVYQVLDGTRKPVNLGLAPSGVRVMHGTIPTAIYQWWGAIVMLNSSIWLWLVHRDSIIKIYTKHKSVNLKLCSVHVSYCVSKGLSYMFYWWLCVVTDPKYSEG